jgi:membrane dipeptidase
MTSATRALDLLAAAQLVDGHNDLPWALRTLGRPVDLAAGVPELHTDLPRLRAGRVGAQFWSVYVPCSFTGPAAVATVLEQVALVRELAERYPDDLQLATTVAEVEAALAAGRVASLMGAEGGHGIDGSLDALRELRRRGVRYLTLTHNRNTPWADSATDEPAHGGLTAFGREVVREMNRLGMLVDLSHVSPGTMSDALDVSEAPVIFSHSSARALVDHPRNVPDSILARLPKNGGVVMVTFVPAFVSQEVADWEKQADDDKKALVATVPDSIERQRRIDQWLEDHPRPNATLQQVADHIEHVRAVAGVDHVGIGSDFDGVDFTPVGLEDTSKFPALFAELIRRGWSDADLKKLAGQNLLRVFHRAEAVAARLQQTRPPSTKTIEELEGTAVSSKK